MQNDPYSFIFNRFGKVESITWYVHTGLTDNLINDTPTSHSNYNNNNNNNNNSNNKNVINDYKIYKIKNVNYFITGKPNDQTLIYHLNKELENQLTFQESHHNIHFRGIPVVDYNESKNNSFVWQKIPKNTEYTQHLLSKNNLNQQPNPLDSYLNKIDCNKIDLTNSARNQFGFVIKAVINGMIHSISSSS